MKKINLMFILTMVFSLTSCEAHFGETRFDVPWWLIAIPIVLVMVIVHIYIVSKQYKCPKCGKSFRPKWYEISSWLHIGNKRLVKCPKCGHKGFCKYDD